jgi:hypothetical protein
MLYNKEGLGRKSHWNYGCRQFVNWKKIREGIKWIYIKIKIPELWECIEDICECLLELFCLDSCIEYLIELIKKLIKFLHIKELLLFLLDSTFDIIHNTGIAFLWNWISDKLITFYYKLSDRIWINSSISL